MALRQRIIPLDGLPVNVATGITVNCAYWFLRIAGNAQDLKIDGVTCDYLGTGGAVSIDYPPLFDAHGRPVMWNQRLAFTPTGTVKGVVILVYLDEALPDGPR